MKRLTVVSGICASFLLGTAITALAQDQEEHRNDKQENARPENRQEQARPQEQSRPEDRRNQEPQSGDRKNTTPQSEGRQNQEPQSGDRHPRNQENDRQVQDRQQQQRQQPQQPRQGENEPGREVNGRQDQARPEGQARGGERHGGNQRRIPDSDFHAHFGREHRFAPGRMQVYNGQPQFYYSGYTFALIQAWPDDWSFDADDYYIDEFDGEYWLVNLENPGVRLELIIVQ